LLCGAGPPLSILACFSRSIFILNSLGYLGFLAAYFLPLPIAKDNHRLVRLAFMGYVVINLLAWVAIGDKSWPAGTLGYITKLIETPCWAALGATGAADRIEDGRVNRREDGLCAYSYRQR
jgi:hypothetical protein